MTEFPPNSFETAAGGLRRRLVIISVANLIIGLMLVGMGLLSAAADIRSLGRYALLYGTAAARLVELPPVPRELVSFDRLKGLELAACGALLGIGALGMLLSANWGRLLTIAYSFLFISAGGIFLVADTLHYQPLSAPWAEQTREMLLMTADVQPPRVFGLLALKDRLLTGLPFMLYSVFLFTVLTRPAVKRAFGIARRDYGEQDLSDQPIIVSEVS